MKLNQPHTRAHVHTRSHLPEPSKKYAHTLNPAHMQYMTGAPHTRTRFEGTCSVPLPLLAAERRNMEKRMWGKRRRRQHWGSLSGHHLILAVLAGGWWALYHCLTHDPWIMDARLHGSVGFTVFCILDGGTANTGGGEARVWGV